MGAVITSINAPVAFTLAFAAHAAANSSQAPVAPAARTEAAASHAASAVALAPAAMAVLLQAQAQGDQPQPAAARAQSVQQIDRLISRLSDAPPPPAPQTTQAPGQSASFSMAMLLAARQQLTEVRA